MKKLLACIIVLVCAFSTKAAQTQGEIAGYIVWEMDSVVRAKDANRAVKLLEYVEQQNIEASFNITGGPKDKDRKLYQVACRCADLLQQSTLDSRWVKLAKTPVEDTAAMARMLDSENAGERVLALEKLLMSNNYSGGLEEQLLAIQQNDPLVYFGISRQGMRGPLEPPQTEPVYGRFFAHLRSIAREVLAKQGIEVEPEEEFRKRYEEFGVERLIGIFPKDDPYLRDGVLRMFLQMNLDSYGAKHLNSMERHSKISDEYLYILKLHLNKKMDITSGLVLEEDLKRAFESYDGNMPIIVSSQTSVTEETESIVSKKEKIFFSAEEPTPETGVIVSQTNNNSIEPAPQATPGKSFRPWSLVFPVVGILLAGIFAFFEFKKR